MMLIDFHTHGFPERELRLLNSPELSAGAWEKILQRNAVKLLNLK